MNLLPREHLSGFESLFDNFFPSVLQSDKNLFSPKVDIHEKENHYEILADLPGVKKEDINVSLQNGILSIEASMINEDTEEKEGKVIRRERHSGSFMRSFNVGNTIHQEDINASFENGVLTLVAPKVGETSYDHKKIEIR
jgi:HSP20 family protein